MPVATTVSPSCYCRGQRSHVLISILLNKFGNETFMQVFHFSLADSVSLVFCSVLQKTWCCTIKRTKTIQCTASDLYFLHTCLLMWNRTRWSFFFFLWFYVQEVFQSSAIKRRINRMLFVPFSFKKKKSIIDWRVLLTCFSRGLRLSTKISQLPCCEFDDSR